MGELMLRLGSKISYLHALRNWESLSNNELSILEKFDHPAVDNGAYVFTENNKS